MSRVSITPLYDSLHNDAIKRLLSDEPGYESLVLRGHLLVERALGILINGALAHPDRLDDTRRLAFDQKIALAEALGVVPGPYAAAIKGLNRLRNAIAHRDGYAPTLNDLLGLRLDWDGAFEARLRREFTDDPGEAINSAIPFLVWTCFELVDTFERKKVRQP